MPRAKIPYSKIRKALNKKYPAPLYLNVIIREDYTPIAVYDRTSGNYKRIGFRMKVEMNQFVGIDKGSSYTGFQSRYKYVKFDEVVLIED